MRLAYSNYSMSGSYYDTVMGMRKLCMGLMSSKIYIKMMSVGRVMLKTQVLEMT